MAENLHEKYRQSCSLGGVSISQSKIIVQREEAKMCPEGEMASMWEEGILGAQVPWEVTFCCSFCFLCKIKWHHCRDKELLYCVAVSLK